MIFFKKNLSVIIIRATTILNNTVNSVIQSQKTQIQLFKKLFILFLCNNTSPAHEDHSGRSWSERDSKIGQLYCTLLMFMDLVRHTFMLTIHGQISLRGKKPRIRTKRKRLLVTLNPNLMC